MEITEDFAASYGGTENMIHRLVRTGQFENKTFRLSEASEKNKVELFSQLVQKHLMSQETFDNLTNQSNKIDLTQELVLSILK